MAEGVEPLVITQDWETGKWFPEQTWEVVCARRELSVLADSEAFVRMFFSQNACRLDDERAKFSNAPALQEAFTAFVKAQSDLAEADVERNRLEYEAKKISDLQVEINKVRD